MQTLYRAIVALGRSITEIDVHGWRRGEIGRLIAPKCAIGLLSHGLLGYPIYIADFGFSEDGEVRACEPPARMAAEALYEALGAERQKRLHAALHNQDLVNHDEIFATALGRFQAGESIKTGELESFVVIANDKVIQDEKEARQWFSDALDVLAEQLPIPAQPLYAPREAETLQV